ncbi:hypothetical protein AX17_001661 [Amanita inopinata Kibby_2008]|nr:hypothetical protein AX17_001661 [Amanita inopinata Kibby_2008]
MFFSVTSRLVSSIGAFFYPGYASYKTLSQRPASEEELERWLMYWSVLGCIIGIEYVAEWLISWIPFYYTLKTIFLLYLALPQTRGSSYIYINHLSPFFRSHETQIDATLASFRAKVVAFVQTRAKALWENVLTAAGQQQSAAFSPAGGEVDTGAPPSLGDPASGPVQLMSSLWTSYGPGVLASGAALLRQTTLAATALRSDQRATLSTPRSRTSAARGEDQQSLKERKRRLEAELAALSQQTGQSVPMPSASPALAPSRGSSDSDLRLRERTNSTTSGGRFEEVEVPSDVEGYDIGNDDQFAGGESEDGRPVPVKRSSWFGWSGSSKDGYERVKSE